MATANELLYSGTYTFSTYAKTSNASIGFIPIPRLGYIKATVYNYENS